MSDPLNKIAALARQLQELCEEHDLGSVTVYARFCEHDDGTVSRSRAVNLHGRSGRIIEPGTEDEVSDWYDEGRQRNRIVTMDGCEICAIEHREPVAGGAK